MKTINLSKMLGNELFSEVHRGCSMSDTTYNAILKAMKEACKQTLELAAENADIVYAFETTDGYIGNTNWYVDKETILRTINQIK